MLPSGQLHQSPSGNIQFIHTTSLKPHELCMEHTLSSQGQNKRKLLGNAVGPRSSSSLTERSIRKIYGWAVYVGRPQHIHIHHLYKASLSGNKSSSRITNIRNHWEHWLWILSTGSTFHWNTATLWYYSVTSPILIGSVFHNVISQCFETRRLEESLGRFPTER